MKLVAPLVDSMVDTAVWRPSGGVGGILTPNLVSWWTMDETTGNRADSHGTNTLTEAVATTYVAGKKSNAADFYNSSTATASRLQTATAGTIALGTSDFAIAFWFNQANVAAEGRIVQNRGAGAFGAVPGFHLNLYSSGSVVWINANSGIDDGTTFAQWGATSLGVASGAWHLMVMNFSRSGNWDILLNGSSTPTASLNISAVTGSVTGAEVFSFGTHTAVGQLWSGYLDEAAIWIGRTLDATAISTLYNSGSGITYTDL